MRIFIPGNVPSSKNSKAKCSNGIFHSAAVRHYLQKIGVAKYSVHKRTVENYKTRPNRFEAAIGPVKEELLSIGVLPVPLIVGMYFVRSTEGKFDWINIAQIICDLLVAHRVIPDDSMDVFVPVPIKRDGCWYHVDKKSPGCILDFWFEGKNDG